MKEKRRWVIQGKETFPEGKVFEAHTRSEARALAKKELGLQRLPPGQHIREA